MADYPAAVTSFSSLIDNVTPITATHHNDVADEVVATQNTLGVNPQGGSATVVARLNVVDGLVAASWVMGGRLSLSSGVPVTTSDVASSTNIYYTPYIHNAVQLWNGTKWVQTTFTETTMALGTMTAARGYDVFGYLSSGSLALEKLVWTSATARATAITLQDGRYCKSGDKTRLYLGSFYSTSTTQTADAEATRFVWNMYNRRPRSLKVDNSTSHNYNVATVRAFNNDQAASDIEYFIGLAEDAISICLIGQITRAATDGNPRISLGINSTTTETSIYGLAITSVGRTRGGSSAAIIPTLGYSYICGLEYTTAGTAPGATFEASVLTGIVDG